jgi:hypothetical protein
VRRLERVQHLRRALRAIGRPLLQAAHEECCEPGRHARPKVRERRGRLQQVCGHHRLRGRRREWRAAGQDLVAEDAERVDVGAVIGVRVCRGPADELHRGRVNG